MTYDLKNVFYLDTSAAVAASTAGGGSAQLDLSAYIDPIARGRTKGTGLAIYKVHFSLLDASGTPVDPADVGVLSVSMQAGLGVGDNATGTAFQATGLMDNTNALNIATSAYYAPGSMPDGGDMLPYVMPSTEVPYVVVRDNACLIYAIRDQVSVDDILLSVRLECAQITLDQATLNQLLRTQTV